MIPLRSARHIAALSIALLVGCSSRAAGPLPPVPSPDGSLSIQPSINRSKADKTTYLCIHFRIVNKSGAQQFATQTSASDRMRWSFEWRGNDHLVLHSSDIGTLQWKRQPDGSWHELPQ